MNAACAIVASHAIGSVGFLIKNGENGLIYRNGNQKELNNAVTKLLDNRTLSAQLGKNAYHTLADLWNADVAAQRLLALFSALSNGNYTPYDSGPCSIAPRKYG